MSYSRYANPEVGGPLEGSRNFLTVDTSKKVRVISQINLTLGQTIGPGQGTSYDAARFQALNWLEKSARTRFPTKVWEGESFESDAFDAHRASIISIRKPTYWAARLDFPDREVPQRFWVTELGLGEDNNKTVLFGCRLQCVTMGEDVPFSRSVPGVVKQIGSKLETYLDGVIINIEPKIAQTHLEVDELFNLLINPHRHFDVIIHSLPDGSEDPKQTALNVDYVASKTFGAGHHYILTSAASYYLTDLVDKEFSVFQQAVRTYRPGFNPDTSDPLDHPLALSKRIENWNSVGKFAFQEFFIDSLLSSTIRRRDLDWRLPSFQTVKQVSLERERITRREEGANDTALLELADQEIRQLKSDIEEIKTENDTYLQLAEADRQRDKADLRGLRARIEALLASIKKNGDKIENEVIPTTFSNLDEWALNHLSGYVVLHPRALRVAKKTLFEDAQLAYRALLILRDQYRQMRLGQCDRTDYEAALVNLNLDDSPCFSGQRSGEYGDEYFVEYYGRKLELDRHLKGSNSRDPRFGFRMYFCWDEVSEQVIVGSFPEHLTTGAS